MIERTGRVVLFLCCLAMLGIATFCATQALDDANTERVGWVVMTIATSATSVMMLRGLRGQYGP